ncbi:MAG: hypothetical protein ACYDBV_08715 [Nitrospiria bacterium]
MILQIYHQLPNGLLSHSITFDAHQLLAGRRCACDGDLEMRKVEGSSSAIVVCRNCDQVYSLVIALRPTATVKNLLPKKDQSGTLF